MSQYFINIGALPNDGTGDPLRTAFNDTNLNFDQIFAAGPVLSNVQIVGNKILTLNTNGNLVLSPNGVGRVVSNVSILPNATNTHDLGSPSLRWNTVYSTYMDFANLSVTGNLVAGNIFSGAYYYANGDPFIGGAGGVIQSNVAPADPTSKTLWWDEVSGRLYVWYTDVDGSQWVDAAPATGFGGGGANVDFLNVASSIVPAANVTYGLGNATNQWANLWVSGNTIYLGGVPLTTSGNTLNVNGAPITAGSVDWANVTNKTGNLGPTSIAVGRYANAGANSVSLGTNAGAFGQSYDSVAIGLQAGETGQEKHSVAIGTQAGHFQQGEDAVAIGWNAGRDNQTQWAVAIGYNAGYLNQSFDGVAIGQSAGRNYQGADAVAIGRNAGYSGNSVSHTYSDGPYYAVVLDSVSDIVVGQAAVGNNITPGTLVSAVDVGNSTIALSTGFYPGVPSDGDTFNFHGHQGINSVAIGAISGFTDQGANSVAVGAYAGYTSQQYSSVAVGYRAGYTGQQQRAVALGEDAGHINQGEDAVAIGQRAGYFNQGRLTVAIGNTAGSLFQDHAAVAVGLSAGNVSQGYSSVAIGWFAGNNHQGYESVAVGEFAAIESQGPLSVAIGTSAGANHQGTYSVAVGTYAGSGTALGGSAWSGASGTNSLKIFNNAQVRPGQLISAPTSGAIPPGTTVLTVSGEDLTISQNLTQSLSLSESLTFLNPQGSGAVALGYGSGSSLQGQYAVALGYEAGATYQAGNSVAIGFRAGYYGQGNNSIIINATGANLDNTTDNTFTVKPIRNASAGNVLFYNDTTGEITYNTAAAVTAIANGNSNVTIATSNGNVTVNANDGTDYAWIFGNDGELYLPTGGRIGATKGGTMLDGGNGNITSLTSFYANGYYAGCFTAYPDGNVTITTYTGNGAQGIWTFDNTGNLTLQYGSLITEVPSPIPGNYALALAGTGQVSPDQQLLVYPTSFDANHLHLTSGNLYNTELYLGNDNLYVKLGNTGNVVVNANDSVGNIAQWVFGANGNLTLPGGHAVLSISNSGYLTTLGNDTTSLAVDGDNGIVTIATNGGSTTYTFVDEFNTTTSANVLSLTTRNGDSNPNHTKPQIVMGYNGTGDYPQFIHTIHNAGSAAYNTIDFYTSDGTQAGTFPANAVLGLTVTNGTIKTGVTVTTPVALNSLTAEAGARAFVNNANLVAAGNFGAQISGSGSNTVPVWSDGANWYIG